MPLLNVDGNTPLTPEELADLIPNLAAREELNEWERRWALRRASVKNTDPISG